jgi:hypothetical protein
MTLAECLELHGLVGYSHGDRFVVYPGIRTHNPDLWHCSDYTVSGVSGGCVWLIKKKG